MKKQKNPHSNPCKKLAKEEKLVSLDRPKTPTIEKDMDSQSSQFSPTFGSIIPPHIPHPMFPTRFQSDSGLIPHPNSPAAIRELIEPCLRSPLDVSLDLPKTPTIETDIHSQLSQFSPTRGSIIPPKIPYPMFPTRFQSGPGLTPHPNSPAAIRKLIEPCSLGMCWYISSSS